MTARFLCIVALLLLCACDEDRGTSNDPPPEDAVSCAGVPVEWVGTDVIYHPDSLAKPQTLLLITAFWCRPCLALEDTTLVDSVVEEITCESFNAIRVDPWDDSSVVCFDSTVSCSLFCWDEWDVAAWPTMFVLDSLGETLGMILGYKPPDVFAELCAISVAISWARQDSA
ncbi:MAG: hypothetical protein ABIE70_02705 [bacterium]